MQSRTLSYAVVLCAGLALCLVTPGQASARAADTVRLVTNGYGHGHGMSQNGADARGEAGQTYRQILRFYYPGLAQGTAAGSMRVLISADTSPDVVVLDRAGLKVTSLGSGRTYDLTQRKDAERWRITPASGGRSTIASKARRGSWRPFKTVPGSAQFTAGGSPITLVTPSGRAAYRGALRSVRRDTVNVVPLEAYLRGVVAREMPTYFDPEALRAQSVAARTFAAYERGASKYGHFDVYDTTSSQVYGGVDDEYTQTDAAIRATARQVLTYQGKPAYTQFSSSNGGWMAAGSQPYLVAKQDPFDDIYRSVAHTIEPREIEAAFPSIGTFRSLKVLERDGNGQWGGRVESIRVIGSKGSVERSGEDFRFTFGLNSSWFQLR